MFLSNWLVFKIVLAAVTGLVDYPLAADVLLKYDDANKLYLEGNSIDYVSNVVLYKGETSYTLGTGDILNKTTTTAYEVVLPSSSVHGTFGINQDATRYVHQYPEASGYQNGKFQVYSGTPSDGYTEYGSEIQPFNGDEIILCSMSADGKYILVTNYNGGFADGYKMYKDNGSEYVYHSSYACIGSSTNNDTGYKPAFVPSNNNFVITGTGGGSNSDDFYFKLYVYDPLTETWTGKTTVYSLNAPTGDAQRGLFGKLFTYDGKYLMMSDNGTPTRGEVYEVDWDANTMVNVWYTTEGSDGDGAGGAISPDNRYVVLARHDGNPYRVYENMSGDWSTVENVTSQFDLTGSGTGTIFGGYGIEFSGYSSENTTPLYIGQVSYHGDGKFRLENWAKRSPYEMYITQPGTYRADLQICGIDYKTNTVEVTGTPSDIEVFKEPETNFSTSNALFSQNGFYTASGSSDATYLLIHPTSTSITVYKGTPDNGYTSYYTDSTNVNINPATMSHDGLYIVKRSSANTIDLYKHNTSTQTYVKTSGKFSTPYDVYKIGFLPNSYDFGYTVTNGSNESVLYLHKYNSGDTWDTPTSINLTSIYSLSTSANYGRYGISFSKKDTNGNCLLAFADSFASSNELYILNVNWNTMSTSLVRSINTSVSYSWTVSFTRDGVYLWIAQSSGATRQMFKSTDNWVSYEDVTSSFTNSQYLGSHTTTFLKEYVIGAHYENPVSGIEDVIRLYKWQDLISPTLTFDGYNQLSLTNTPTYTSSKLTYGSNVYDIGTLTSDITIEKPGEYASLTFDTSSNVAYFSNVTVGAMGTTLADYVVDTTIYGTVQSGQTHQIGQGGFGNNTILNADGTRLLITDPLNYPSGRGRAYIYHLENGSWVLKQTWDNPNNTGQRFADGACMNEDGTRIFLMHNASEKVYTYEYTNGAWPTDNTGTHVITVGTNIGAEYEGLACNKAGDVLLMGHGNANTAYIYRRASATSWSQDSGGSFTKGRGVAMNGDGTRAFIGNSTDGTVHMTEWNGSTWSSLTQIIDESYSNWPCTMMSDSVGETLVIVSGNGDSSSGNSGIYERDSGTGLWSRAQGVNADTEIYGMRLPSISYDGTMVLVGSFRYDSSKGRAQLWQKSNGAWTLKKEYLNPDTSPASSDQFGAGCGIARTTKDKFVIGMEGDDTAGTDYGSVYVYNNTIPDFISFDTYNKLSLSGLTNPTSKIHVLPTGAETTTVYDIGTATNIYIESEGTYTAEMKGSDGFALVSNVVGTGQISEPPVYSSATPTLVDPIDITDGIWSSLTYQWYQTHSTYYLYKLSGDPNDSDRFIKYDWVNLVWSDQDQSGTYSTFGTSATDTTATARSITNPTHIYLMAGSQLHATMVNPYYQVPNYSPSLTHDTYNKLSIENITPTASTLRLGSNTYDIGTATDIYIEDTGTYEIETKDSNTFAFASNTATYQVHPNTAYSNYRSIGGISAASTSLHNENITTTYSVTMWAKSASATYIVRTANSDTNASGNNTHGIFGINSSGEFSIPSWTSGDSISVSFSGTPDYRDEWHFYGFEFNDTTIKVHIDGATPITGSTGYSGQTHNRMRFDNPNAFTDGTRLAEFAVYNRALSDAEFVSIYNNGLPNGPDNVSSGRVSWFKCLSGAMGTNSGTGGDFDASFTEDTDVPSAWLDPTPSLTHDTYNKLSIENITPTASTLRLGSNTYDIGTATDIYIEDTGTYEIETKDANTFALVSNVVDTVTQVGAYDSSATPTLVDPIDITDGIWSSLTYQWYQTHSTYYLYKLSGDPNDSDRFIKYDWVNLVWSDQDQSGTYSTFGTSATDTTATARSITNPTHIYLMAGSQLHATMVNPYYQVPNYSPSLTHDTYNKLSIENITPTASTLRLGSNTYDIGTATDIYIEDTGTYEIETKDANTFAFTNTTVSGTIKTIEPALVGGNSHLHALAYDGKLYAWGINDDGELGLGDNTNKTTPTLYSGPLVSKILNKGWSGGNTRNETSWIKTVGNDIYATGKGDTYMIPGTSSDLLSFTDVTSYFGDQSLTSNNVVFVGGGERSCVALTESGNVWTWGTHDSSLWNLGQGTGASSSNTPKQITFGGVTDNISRVAFGHDHGIALDTDGDVWFWGQIWAGGAGVDYPQTTLSDAQKSPHEIMTSNNIIGVSSTHFTIYAWQSDGTYYALGLDSTGPIGDGTVTAGGYTSWQKVEYFSANNITINEIYTGIENVFADTSDGYYCWGFGGNGSFGNGGTGNLASPTKWTNVSNIKLFSAGGTNMGAAITEDGKYYAWGSGNQTQRGDNSTSAISYPKYIDTLPNILAPSFEFDGYDKVFVYNIDHLLAVPVFPNQLEHVSGALYGTYSWRYYETTSTHIIYMMYNDTTSAFFDVPVSAIQVGLYGQPDYDTWTDAVVAVSNHPNSVTENSDGTVTLDYSGTSYSFVKPTNAYWHWKLDPIKTVKFSKNAIEYDANKAQIVTISDSGTYDAQLSQGSTFSLKSTTIPATKASGLYTWAFHHGNFDNAYGDGDILTARDNGRFYADTPSYTGDIGTITAGSSTTSNTTYTFTPASTLTANVLMVAGGGGGGGRYNCGGGGAGGLVYTVGTTLSGTKTIVVGNGDSGGNGGAQSGYNGKDTTFTGLTTAVGGGYGGTHGAAGGTGGSGGGGGGQTGNGPGGSATSGQGFAGGTGSNSGSTFGGGGGGGGAGDVGGNGSDGVGGNGGIGKFFGTGSSYTDFGDEYGEGGYFASGAGGGSKGSTAGGIPGRGGGGYGARYYGYMGIGGSQHALPHTGGGGGGSGTVDRDQHPGYASNGDGGVLGHGGRGGSGIVLLQTNVALPNGSNTAVVQVGNPRRRSLPPTVDYMGSEVNRFSIIDGASMPTYKLPTHWYVDPIGSHSNSVWSTQGAHSLQKRADGGTSNVFYVTSTEGLFEYGHKMAQSADAIFMPVEAQRYNGLLAIGSNSTNDIHFEMAADGTAALYYDNGATLLSAGTIKCFTVGKWHHIALTVDSGGNAVGYVNGYPVVSGTYTSVAAVGSRSGNMHMRVGDHSITFRKFLTYEVSTYNFHMSPKQVLQRAAEVGLGPKLEYDGLNAINVVNAEPGSGTEITIYESNANDTSNLYVVSCNESSYLLSNAGTYYAQIKGTDTFTITRPLTVTDDHFPLYQYPPIDGTTSGLTTSTTTATWTISGVQYSTESSVAGSPYNTFDNSITSGFDSASSTGDITITFESSKTIRKYIVWPYDSTSPVSTPGGNTDPTLSTDGTFRPKSWTLYGYTDSTGWVSLDTVTNQPPSIYGDVHSISSPASYLYYKLSVTANNGGSGLKIGEWQLWGDA